MYYETKLAKSVQRDYLSAAETARLVAQNSNSNVMNRALVAFSAVLGLGSVLVSLMS